MEVLCFRDPRQGPRKVDETVGDLESDGYLRYEEGLGRTPNFRNWQ